MHRRFEAAPAPQRIGQQQGGQAGGRGEPQLRHQQQCPTRHQHGTHQQHDQQQPAARRKTPQAEQGGKHDGRRGERIAERRSTHQCPPAQQSVDHVGMNLDARHGAAATGHRRRVGVAQAGGGGPDEYEFSGQGGGRHHAMQHVGIGHLGIGTRRSGKGNAHPVIAPPGARRAGLQGVALSGQRLAGRARQAGLHQRECEMRPGGVFGRIGFHQTFEQKHAARQAIFIEFNVDVPEGRCGGCERRHRQ